MKALSSIGYKKAIRFVLFTMLSNALHLAIIPQIRSMIISFLGAKVGTDSIIHDVTFTNLYHYGFKNLVVGKQCFIGEEVMLDVRGKILLGNHVTISNRCAIVTHINVGFDDHPLQTLYPTTEGTVIIEEGAYIGTGAIILPGITIGKHSVIGAGAVVTKNVAAHTVVVGVPAHSIKKLPH